MNYNDDFGNGTFGGDEKDPGKQKPEGSKNPFKGKLDSFIKKLADNSEAKQNAQARSETDADDTVQNAAASDKKAKKPDSVDIPFAFSNNRNGGANKPPSKKPNKAPLLPDNNDDIDLVFPGNKSNGKDSLPEQKKKAGQKDAFGAGAEKTDKAKPAAGFLSSIKGIGKTKPDTPDYAMDDEGTKPSAKSAGANKIIEDDVYEDADKKPVFKMFNVFSKPTPPADNGDPGYDSDNDLYDSEYDKEPKQAAKAGAALGSAGLFLKKSYEGAKTFVKNQKDKLVSSRDERRSRQEEERGRFEDEQKKLFIDQKKSSYKMNKMRQDGKGFDDTQTARPKQLTQKISQADLEKQHTQVIAPAGVHQQQKKTNGKLSISEDHMTADYKTHVSIFAKRRRQQNFIISIILTTLKLFVLVALIIGVIGFGGVFGIAKAYWESTPDLDVTKILEQEQTSFIYDCNNNEITAYTGAENREWAKLDEIPMILREAVIAIEDVRFYSHGGVDLKRLASAFFNSVASDSDTHGASTITQQLIKNRILTNIRSYKRKVQEANLAMELEKKMTKDQILESYLNTIHLGESNYGVKAAAKDYFGKELKDLNLTECAILAGVIKNPTKYNPRKNKYERAKADPKAYDVTAWRANTVLVAMWRAGFISEQQKDQAKLANDEEAKQGKGVDVHIEEISKIKELYTMPYFVEYAIQDICKYILMDRNMTDNIPNRLAVENELRTKGYRIYLTVDPKIQDMVQSTLENWEKYPRMKRSSDNYVNYIDGDQIERVRQPQAASVVFDYHAGELKAVVGGRDRPTRRKQLNRAWKSQMPVGSSIKPPAVYGPALDMGKAPSSVISNKREPIKGWKGGKGYPAGGGKDGMVTLRSALVNSMNVAAARLLAEYVTVDRSREYMMKMGVDSAHVSGDNATISGLSLGSAPITPIEMVGCFGTIANQGIYTPPLSFRKVVDSNNNMILDATKIRQARSQQVFKPETAWLLTDILEEAVAKGTGKPARLGNNMHAAGKTGTNDLARGVCFTGYTAFYCTTVWIGHDRFAPLTGSAYGGQYAAPIWRAINLELMKDEENTGKEIIAEKPEDIGLKSVSICGASGKLAGSACSYDLLGNGTVRDYISKDAEFEEREKCNEHVLLTVCEESGMEAGPNCPKDQLKKVSVIPNESAYKKALAEKYPNYKNGVHCTLHTSEWVDEQNQRSTAINAAKKAISSANSKVKKAGDDVSDDAKNNVKKLASDLNKLIAKANATVEQIIEKTNALKNAADAL